MSFFLNKELVEICSFEKTFKTEPALQDFILKHLKNVHFQKQWNLSVYPTSVYGNYFFYHLENQSKCVKSFSTENNKMIWKWFSTWTSI